MAKQDLENLKKVSTKVKSYVDTKTSSITTSLNDEINARKIADSTLQTNINNETTRAKDVEGKLDTRTTTIETKIPSQASSTNQLADKDFVNSSIATATATFRGTVSTIAELKNLSGDLNDYAFVRVIDTTTGLVKQFDKYKYTATASAETGNWVYEYTLNNSSFTEAQWKAITSGITSDLVTQISTNKTNITSHTSNISNPHKVTATQIGLGNVDNTSDASLLTDFSSSSNKISITVGGTTKSVSDVSINSLTLPEAGKINVTNNQHLDLTAQYVRLPNIHETENTIDSYRPLLLAQDTDNAILKARTTLAYNGKTDTLKATNITATNYSGKVNDYTFDLSTNNTSDTWIPVIKSSTLQHRIIPIDYNNPPSTLNVNSAVKDENGNNIVDTYTTKTNTVNNLDISLDTSNKNGLQIDAKNSSGTTLSSISTSLDSVLTNTQIGENTISLKGLFAGNPMKELPKGLNLNNVYDLEETFMLCTNLEQVNFIDNINNVVNMTRTFAGCKSLKFVRWGKNVKVSNMSYMFYGCKDLLETPEIDVSHLQSGGLTKAFSKCYSLRKLNLKHINQNINLRDCLSLDYFALQDIIENLDEVEYKIIDLGSHLLSKLYDEDIKKIESKGWIVL